MPLVLQKPNKPSLPFMATVAAGLLKDHFTTTLQKQKLQVALKINNPSLDPWKNVSSADSALILKYTLY